jgi:hypothetical protein
MPSARPHSQYKSLIFATLNGELESLRELRREWIDGSRVQKAKIIHTLEDTTPLTHVVVT